MEPQTVGEQSPYFRISYHLEMDAPDLRLLGILETEQGQRQVLQGNATLRPGQTGLWTVELEYMEVDPRVRFRGLASEGLRHLPSLLDQTLGGAWGWIQVDAHSLTGGPLWGLQKLLTGGGFRQEAGCFRLLREQSSAS